jgi:hypothetical protein
MSISNSYPLEITQALMTCAGSIDFSFGEDTALVAVQHMLLQTVDLFETIGAIGLDLRNCFALGKVYSNNQQVIKSLRELGVTVLDATIPGPGEFHATFDRDVERLWDVAASALARRRINRILVLDDAGVCISKTPAYLMERYAICGVEQTSQGTFLFEKRPPPIPVISWARSAVKLEIGGPIFAECFLEKLNSEFLRGATLAGAQVGIIGLGSIGKGVANLILRQGAEVSFYDRNPALRAPRSLRERAVRVDSLEELMVRCDYVIGCSGRQPFEGNWPLSYRPGVSLLSASGGDQEFAAIIRDLKGRTGFVVDSKTRDISSADGPSGPLCIPYSGYPYNFVSRGIEAVPTRVVQLETGGLLASLIQARLYLDLETGQIPSQGMHRVSPAAQRFVYGKWLRAMAQHNVNMADRFAYDSAMLSAAQEEDWFVRNSEPHPGKDYEPLKGIEDLMARLLRGGYCSRAPTKA